MALPGDVTTYTLHFGAYYDGAGNPAFAGMTGKIRPSRSPIRHTDGSVLVDEPIPVTIDAFGEASVELVHNDHGGGFTYSMVWDVASRKPSPGNNPAFFVSSAFTTADYDELAESDDVPGVAVPTALSVNGRTGAVVLTASDVGAATPNSAAGIAAGMALVFGG